MNKYWSGFMTHVALLSLYQDFLGKDKYLQAADLLWVSWKITVPLALVLLILALMLFHSTERTYDHQR